MTIRANTLRATARLKFETRHAWESAVATVRGNGITAYWYRDVLNFGDLITPLLLRHYGFTPVYDRPNRARLVAAGSVLEHLRNDYAGIILGSGFIEEKSRMNFPQARVLAVRGALTRERMGCGPEVALGDPGLLASRVLLLREPKKFALGIVPHHSEKSNLCYAQLATKHPKDITIIHVERQPLDVFRHIDQCEHILSSSLHGLIVADSLGIPNGWLASKDLWGGRFKFDDYYSALDIRADGAVPEGNETVPELLALATAKPGDKIESLKERLHQLWTKMGSYR